MQVLLDEAQRLGVNVAYAALPPPLRAAYLDDQALIVISDRLDRIQAGESLAHELAHRKYGDRCSSSDVEERAWRYAAKLAIDVNDYRRAEIADSHPATIARELRTTRRLVELFQAHHLPSLVADVGFHFADLDASDQPLIVEYAGVVRA